jgi:lipoprotein-anchoring transpeptidase ErfK/SrfK
MKSLLLLLIVCLGGTACNPDRGPGLQAERVATGADAATLQGGGSDRLSRDELEAGRMVMDWRQWVERDASSLAVDPVRTASPAAAETWDAIDVESVNHGPTALPVSGDVQGPSVVRVQILLGRAAFSPGIIDGLWGRNTEKAVYWLQRREGLDASGEVDEATWRRLLQLAGQPRELVRAHQLTTDDVAGPFVQLPEEFYDRRDMDCQCYESLAEKLAERFHTSEDLLQQLNPEVDLNTLRAGTLLHVPNIERQGATARVEALIVSDGGRYLHAVDADDRIIFHFPATLGSAYSPSPTGDYRITGIVHDPTWHYQPALLEGVDDDEPSAVLPPGPNNAVGTVWMQLSRQHYGIHGTAAPETIGYATSNGCVRLTNWDVEFLARFVEPGVRVRFRDVD